MKLRSSCPPICARPAGPSRCFVRCTGTAHHLRQVRHISWLLSRERSGFPSENDPLTSREGRPLAFRHHWCYAADDRFRILARCLETNRPWLAFGVCAFFKPFPKPCVLVCGWWFCTWYTPGLGMNRRWLADRNFYFYGVEGAKG